ncbi:MAG TPA: PDZ domain-containing protein [Nitrososphaerales archaeon]|nr:PDZ domain-containing protein [Nitrososphaerales archaeon]
MNAVEYRISMARAKTHTFDVTLVLEDVADGPVDFVMPVWAPGTYRIAEFERNITTIEAEDARGRLGLSKLRKNAWRVEARGEPLRVRYCVYSFERTTSVSYLDSDHALLSPVTLLLCPKGYEARRTIVRLSPAGYCKNISTSLTRMKGALPTFVAQDYDQLVDSPIMIGNFRRHSFVEEGKVHEVAICGGEEIDQERVVHDIRRIVAAASGVFGGLPYDRYVFLIEVDGDVGDDGMEHRCSTYCLVPRLAFTTEHGIKRMDGLFCHEFFHLWNVKRVTPAPLAHLDYEREQYTNSLWIAEGITTYYEHLLLRRAKIYSVPEFLDNIADLINRYLATPGRRLQSAEESSYDSWIKFYRPYENSVNAEISYYTLGALLGMTIDLSIRRATRGEKSLDDVMKKIFSDTGGKGSGYTDQEFKEACDSVAGENLDGLFETHVRGATDIKFDHYLGYAGLTLVPWSGAEGKGAYAGLKFVDTKQEPFVDSVLSDTPAAEAGIFPGDELIGVDGIRFDKIKFKENLRFYVENSKPGRTLTFTVGRAGRLEEVRVRLGRRPVVRYKIQPQQSVNAEQRSLFRGWVGHDLQKFEYSDWVLSPSVDWLFIKPDYF